MKKLIVFILCAFLPMIAAGVAIHLLGGTPSATTVPTDMTKGLIVIAITSLSMFIPMAAVVCTQLIFKEPVLKNIGISFRFNRWWVFGWLAITILPFITIGISLLIPGSRWDTSNEMIVSALEQMPEGFGIWGLMGITLISGLVAGVTLNGVLGFGEEIAWRGFLVKELRGMKFLEASVCIGIIWGLWHAPIILNGHNYPQHPIAGVFMMTLMCTMMTVMLMYFRQKSGSVIVAAIMHGAFNGIAGLSLLVISPSNDLLYGSTGLAGCLALFIINICLFLYDRYISKENIFTSILP